MITKVPFIEIGAETRLLRDAVSPWLCQELITQGLNNNIAPYFWELDKEHWGIYTYSFDSDGIYKETHEIATELLMQESIRQFDVFTVGDLSAAMPPYMIWKQANGSFDMCLDKAYAIDIVSDLRLPDVMARMMLQVMKKRILDLKYINKTISQYRS